MKILLVAHSSGRGGGTQSLIDVVMALEGHEIQVLMPTSTDRWLANSLEAAGAKVYETGFRPPLFAHFNGVPGGVFGRALFLKGLFGQRKFISVLTSIMVREKVDVVAVNSAVLAPLGPYIRRLGARAVCFIREGIPDRGIRTKVMWRALDSGFDDLIFLSSSDENLSRGGRARRHVIHDVLRPGLLHPVGRQQARDNLGLPHDRFVIAFVGGSSWFKGLDTALEAMDLLGELPAILVIAGDVNVDLNKRFLRRLVGAAYRERNVANKEIRRRYGNLSRQGRIGTMGNLNDVSEVYEAADVLVFPSKRAHHARPVFEAGSFGVPVIVSDSSQMRAFVSQEKNGILVSAENPAELAHAIRYLYQDPKTRERMGAANLEATNVLHDFTELRTLLDRVMGAVS